IATRAIARWIVSGEARWRRISSRTDGRRAPAPAASASALRAAATRALALSSVMSVDDNVIARRSVTPSAARLPRGLRRATLLPSGTMLGALGVLAFSFSLPATKLAVRDFDPWLVAFGRAAVASVLAAAVLSATRQRRPTLRQRLRLVIVAGGVVIGFPLFSSLA